MISHGCLRIYFKGQIQSSRSGETAREFPRKPEIGATSVDTFGDAVNQLLPFWIDLHVIFYLERYDSQGRSTRTRQRRAGERGRNQWAETTRKFQGSERIKEDDRPVSHQSHRGHKTGQQGRRTRAGATRLLKDCHPAAL